MASHPIGSKDVLLLVIETAECTVSLKGRPIHPVAEGLGVIPQGLNEHYCASLDIVGEYERAECYDPQAAGSLRRYCCGVPQFACFYEQTGYQLVIENKGDKKLSFYHPNMHLRNAIGPIGTTGNVLSGVLNFRNEVGLTTFVIYADARPILEVTLEIFPSKLNYKEDYFRLVQEVNAEVYNLAFDFLRRTYLKAKLTGQQQASLTEFYSIISFIFDKLVAAFNRVKLYPHQRIITTHEVVKVEKVRRTDHVSRKWLRRNAATLRVSEHGIRVGGRYYLPEKMLDARKRVSYDTYENRMLKWMFCNVLDKLEQLRRRYQVQHEQQVDDEVLQHLSKMTNTVRAMLKERFLQDVGRLTRLDGQSLVLQMAPGYREIYRYYLMLCKGLSIQGSIFQLSMKDVAELYEYWCFLALGSILRQKYHLDRQNAIVVRGDGLAVTLDTTQRADLHFMNKETGEKYVLSYNPRNHDLPTVAQRPDNILTLQKEGSDIEYRYVFDAKYRINPALEGSFYHRSYGAPGPQEEDINTMHRYRDALVYEIAGMQRRNTFGAIILFPYADEAKYAGKDGGEQHKFFTSIEQVGVGGLPFLPGHTKLVENFLDKLIISSPATAHEWAGETMSTEGYYRQRFEPRNVLVGVVASKEHLDYHLQTCTYHIPASALPSGFAHIEYIALYESARVGSNGFNGVRYWGSVQEATLVARSKISIPSSRSTGNEKYVLFTLNKWSKVEPIRPAGYGVRRAIYTTPYLLQQAHYLPELSLKSPEDIRIWQELQRLGNYAGVTMRPKILTNDTAVESFTVGGKTVRVIDDDILLADKKIATVQDLRVRPMYVLNAVRKGVAE